MTSEGNRGSEDEPFSGSGQGRATGEDMANVELLVGLLREALGHVTDKPWDDDTMLHARISEAIGEPVQYADMVARKREEIEY